MNTLPFPPITLTHITIDNAISHGACNTGINKLIDTHQLLHLTAVPVATLLKSKKLTTNEIYWIKRIAALNGHRYETRYGEWNEDGDGYGDGNGCIDEYGYGYSNGDGEGYGYGVENQPL